ncbi:MAG: Hsp20/alpha crystallin family protein [Bacteroidetes bacterium]|nr:Hsp20/alpha crystallin family protein [Bacteroidota bacterium]
MYNYSFVRCGVHEQDFNRERHRLHHFNIQGFKRPKYNVPVNIIDRDTFYEVHVFATGFVKEDFKISFVNDLLFISGKKELPEGEEPKFCRQEFPVKNFERVLYLDGKVDGDNISAKQEKQVLIITLPKTEEAKQEAKIVTIQ